MSRTCEAELQLGSSKRSNLAARDGANNEKGLVALGDLSRQRSIYRIQRDVLATGEETQEGATFVGLMVANRAPENGIRRLKGIEHASDTHWIRDAQLDLRANLRQVTQVIGQDDFNHGSLG